jgi:hypothetical protein
MAILTHERLKEALPQSGEKQLTLSEKIDALIAISEMNKQDEREKLSEFTAKKLKSELGIKSDMNSEDLVTEVILNKKQLRIDNIKKKYSRWFSHIDAGTPDATLDNIEKVFADPDESLSDLDRESRFYIKMLAKQMVTLSEKIDRMEKR